MFLLEQDKKSEKPSPTSYHFTQNLEKLNQQSYWHPVKIVRNNCIWCMSHLEPVKMEESVFFMCSISQYIGSIIYPRNKSLVQLCPATQGLFYVFFFVFFCALRVWTQRYLSCGLLKAPLCVSVWTQTLLWSPSLSMCQTKKNSRRSFRTEAVHWANATKNTTDSDFLIPLMTILVQTFAVQWW